jgi:Family of unknown function (DUF6510)
VTDFMLDGNAMAGQMREIFAMDVTAATVVCAGCGQAEPVATLRLWDHAPGIVARCPHCDDVVLRVVRSPDRAFLDMRGAVRLELPMSS